MSPTKQLPAITAKVDRIEKSKKLKKRVFEKRDFVCKKKNLS